VEEKDLPNWESFQSEIEILRAGHLKDSTSPLLFRGQPNSKFGLTTTLERAGCEGMTVKDFYQLVVNRVRPVIETFTGLQWDVPNFDLDVMKSFNDIELMSKIGSDAFPSVQLYRYLIYLRHHGFPSPLLDWSYSPYVAAFFAFRNSVGTLFPGQPTKRSIFVYCEYSQGSKTTSSMLPSMRAIGPYVRSHSRHFRQQSDYTFCMAYDKKVGWKFHPHESVIGSHGDKQDALWKFNLPSEEGRKVLDLLNQYNLNAFSLFDSAETLLETMWFREHVLRK
jgi:hypothetical protein